MAERSLTVTWEDPRGLAARATEGSGLEFLRAIISGELPKAPIQELLGFELEEADEGRVVFSIEPGEQHYNPIGTVHGGVAATLLDSAMGAAVHSTLPEGAAYVTLEVKFNLVRAITAESGRVLAEGRVSIAASRSRPWRRACAATTASCSPTAPRPAWCGKRSPAHPAEPGASGKRSPAHPAEPGASG